MMKEIQRYKLCMQGTYSYQRPWVVLFYYFQNKTKSANLTKRYNVIWVGDEQLIFQPFYFNCDYSLHRSKSSLHTKHI